MKKSWKLTDKILKKEKKIESRWYKFKHAPWDKIKTGETIYFKDSGEAVGVKAEVSKVMQIDGLTPKKVKELLEKYGNGAGLEKESIPAFWESFKDKRYCLLIFLKNPIRIKPFQISKKGFGNMCAWISVDKIDKIKVK